MARIIITEDNRPTREEFREMLELSESTHSPFNTILSLMRQIVTFEQKYNLPTDVFYARFMRGEMGDDKDFIRWAGRYEAYLEIKQKTEESLTKSAVPV